MCWSEAWLNSAPKLLLNVELLHFTSILVSQLSCTVRCVSCGRRSAALVKTLEPVPDAQHYKQVNHRAARNQAAVWKKWFKLKEVSIHCDDEMIPLKQVSAEQLYLTGSYVSQHPAVLSLNAHTSPHKPEGWCVSPQCPWSCPLISPCSPEASRIENWTSVLPQPVFCQSQRAEAALLLIHTYVDWNNLTRFADMSSNFQLLVFT